MKTLVAFLVSLLPTALFAQRNVSIRPQRAATEQVVAPLLRLDPRAANHSLSAYLPNDVLLTVESQGVSYWPTRTELSRIAQMAAVAVRGVQDSFRSATSEKCVAIHLPVDDAAQTIQYTENTSFANLVLRSGTAQAALKPGFDTVRVLKTYGVKKMKKDTGQLQQIQYMFLLKNLRDLEAVAADEALLDDVAHTMDSVVARRKARWDKDDAWFHSVEVVYKPHLPTEEKARLSVQRGPDDRGDKGLWKGVEWGGSIGGILVRNTLAPAIDFGIGYRWPKQNQLDKSSFVRASISSVFKYTPSSLSQYESYFTDATIFLNFEYGTVFNRPRTLLPVYRTSVGVGYGYARARGTAPYFNVSSIPLISEKSVRFFFSYGVSRIVTIQPELFLDNVSGYVPAIAVKLRL